MYRYFEPKDNDSFLTSDPTYRSILEKLGGFMATLSIDDKALLSKLISNCYHKHNKSIQAKSHNDIELFNSLIMALLVEQSKEIERLQNTII
jgi:metal-responsive CopG/Arc/MetJ family transcriptional regulator